MRVGSATHGYHQFVNFELLCTVGVLIVHLNTGFRGFGAGNTAIQLYV